jgi:hypothetical protein
MQTKRFLKGALAAVVLLAACEQGPLPLAEPSGPMGTVTIRVTAAGAPVAAQSLEAAASPAVARTVVPELSSLTFDAFELTFTGERTIVMTVDADKIDTVTLAVGTYDLAVTGRKGGEAIAEGTAAAPIIIIASDTPAEAAVVLSPKTGGALDAGVFGYDLTLPAVCDAAIQTLTDENGAAFND